MAILGIGAGDIDLFLNRTVLKEGDSFDGRVSLKMKESIKARGVIVEFWAERTERRGKSSVAVDIFRQSIKLDTEREYGLSESRNYTFNFIVPQNILKKPKTEPGLINGIFNFVDGNYNSGIRWFVSAKLDIQMAFDISKKVKLTVSL